jgi:hypothetical protein
MAAPTVALISQSSTLSQQDLQDYLSDFIHHAQLRQRHLRSP